jgi:fucose 4-O-acetylase-like acetyltransferase
MIKICKWVNGMSHICVTGTSVMPIVEIFKKIKNNEKVVEKKGNDTASFR